jgi:alkanesulfonate monooxygenase SsuD/methylene tetrahydromethanopterin reductase-like flavin-dependent oxidoreductase (luciferase family)
MTAMATDRQPGGIAFALRDPLPWDAFARIVRDGEALGYRAVFLPEITGRDAFAALTGLAGETEDLLLGTGIVPMTSRPSRLTAMAAATVQERSAGRMVLGLGTGPAGRGALDTLAGQIQEIREFLERGSDLALHAEPAVPIWIAALGPRAVALAGRVADGVLLNWCSPERVAEARTSLRAAAEEAGRDPDRVTIAVYVRASVGVDPDASLAALREAFGGYASYASYARQFAGMGMGEEAAAAAASFRAGRSEDIPEALVRRICLLGDPAQGRDRLQAYRDAGADLPVVYPALLDGDRDGASVATTLRALASER